MTTDKTQNAGVATDSAPAAGSVNPVDVSNIIDIQLRPWCGRLVRAPKHFKSLLDIGRGRIAFCHRLKIAWMLTILMLKPFKPNDPRDRERS